MNKLEACLKEIGMNATEAMNVLQSHGIVADCAIWPRDVAMEDCDRAIAFIKLS